MKYYLLSIILLLLNSCQLYNDNDTEVIDKALSKWAEAYFNYDYSKAIEYMTPESEKWIRFAASNITQQDIDFLNKHQKDVKVEIVDRYIMNGDTTCSARIRVSDYVQLGFVGQESQITDQSEYQITLTKRNGKWLVKMEGQPQSEK